MKTFLGLFIAGIWLSGVQAAVELTQSAAVVIKPGGSHTMTCQGSGFTFSSYGMHWVRENKGKLQWLAYISYDRSSIYYHDDVKGRFTISRNNNDNMVSLKMDDMKTEDSAVYYCAREGLRAYNAMDVWGAGTSAIVSAAQISGPTVFPLVPCCDIISSSSTVTIGCLSTGYIPEPVHVTWNSGSITTGIKNFPGVRGTNGNYMSINLLTVSPSDFQNNKYTCNVDHKATGIKINMDIGVCDDPTPIPPTVAVMQGSCGETGSVDLVCMISGFNPNVIKIKWLLNGRETSISPTNSTPCKDSEGNFSSTSQISVPVVDWISGDIYTCRVSHPSSDTRIEKSIRKCLELSTASLPKVILNPPSPKGLLVTKEPKLTCEVSKLANTESLTIKWKRNDGKRSQAFQLEPEQQYDGTYTVKSALRISVGDWQSGKSFICTVEHSDLPSPVEKTIHKRDEPTTEPTIYLFPPPTEELSSFEFVTLTALIKKFSHKNVYIQWKKNDIVMDEDKYTNTEPILDEETDTYTMYSTVHINKSDWNRGAKYTCAGFLSSITQKEIKKTRGK